MVPLAFLTGSPADWIIILVVALVVFGPNKLPEVGKQLGQAMKEFSKLKDELTGAAQSLRNEVENVYEPVTRPYSQSHAISSPTVDAATAQHVYDQTPEDLMKPVVQEMPLAEVHLQQPSPLEHEEHISFAPPMPVTETAPEIAEKGH